MQGNKVLWKGHSRLVVRFPFDEHISDNIRRRTFAADVESEELVWHRDDGDRVVHVIESKDWYFQQDDELPKAMKPGDVIYIPSGSWHRVIKRGTTKLVVEIHAA